MAQYTFKINDLGYRTVDAFELDEALERAGIAKGDPYKLVEGDGFEDKCFISTITDEMF